MTEAQRLTALLERLREKCAETAESYSQGFSAAGHIRTIELDVAVRDYLAHGVTPAPAPLDLSDVPVPRENSWQRPSKEWYADKIADTQQAEDAAGGVLAVPAPSSERIPCASCTSEIYCEMNGCKLGGNDGR